MKKFAMVTEEFDAYSFLQFPAAQFLHRWLVRLRKTGTVIEVHLAEFREWVKERKGKSYCRRWVLVAFNKLIELGLIDIVFKYNSQVYKIRVWKEGDSCPLNFSDKNGQKTFKTVQENSQKTASNPDIASSSLYNNKDNTNIPPTNHPVVEKTISSQTTEEIVKEKVSSQEIDAAKIEIIQSLEINPNPHILKIVASVTEKIFNNAIAAVKEQIKQKKVSNPGGMLVRALKEEWSPSNQNISVSFKEIENKNPQGITKSVKEEFSIWYTWARLAGLVWDIPESHLPVVMNEPQVKIDEPDPYTRAPYTMMNWREAQRRYPMPEG